MRQLLEIAEDARRAKYTVAKLGTNDKNRALLAIADALEARADEIIAANAVDIENGRAAGLNDGLIDRLCSIKSALRHRGGLPSGSRPARPGRRCALDAQTPERPQYRSEARPDGRDRHHL